MVDGTAKKEKMLKVSKLTGDIGSLGESIYKSAQSDNQAAIRAAEKEYALAEKADAELAQAVEKFVPSVEQLAKMETGGFTRGDDPRLIARQIVEKEKFAAEAGGRGDIKGAIRLGQEAKAMRDSLKGETGSGTALTAETAETALRNALDTTNKELVAVKEAMAGIIKAQK